MSIGDRKYPYPSQVFPSAHYPEDTAVPTALRYGLENAYSLVQYGGRHAGNWIQDYNFEKPGSLSLHMVSASNLSICTLEAYLAEHTDRVTAHVTWWNGETDVLPQFRININAVAGTWRTPEFEDAAFSRDLIPGLPPLHEFQFSEQVPGGLSIPDAFPVEIEAGPPASGTGQVSISPFSVSCWTEVD